MKCAMCRAQVYRVLCPVPLISFIHLKPCQCITIYIYTYILYVYILYARCTRALHFDTPIVYTIQRREFFVNFLLLAVQSYFEQFFLFIIIVFAFQCIRHAIVLQVVVLRVTLNTAFFRHVHVHEQKMYFIFNESLPIPIIHIGTIIQYIIYILERH